jgi:hypothetical protein
MPETESLKLVFSTNTRCAEWSTIAVFVGLLADIAVILAFDLRDPDKSWWEIGLAGLASLVIAAGVWGEWHFGHKATEASSQLQAKAEDRIAELNNETAKLEAVAAGRNLKPDEIKALGRALKRFSGRTVLLGSYTGDPEAARLAMQIKSAFKLAGIIVADRIGDVGAEPGGVLLGVSVSGELSEWDAVLAIAAAFAEKAHLVVNPPRLPPPLPPMSNKFHPLAVGVGMRPL